MSVFNKYAQYYDLVYKDKDYSCEAEYIHNLIQEYCTGAKSILNLGCGTGRHDLLLADKGYEITGVDVSNEMINIAKSSLSNSASNLSFVHGDIRTIRFNKTFDAIISLFHVMSYQTSNNDLNAVFSTVNAHLKPEGIFIFDCWYGPAVLTEKPEVRVKRLENNQLQVTRIAEPVMRPQDNCVDVHYQVFVTDKETGKTESFSENHSMRYLFMPEIICLLSENGLSALSASEWLTGKEPASNTWGVCIIAKAAA